MGEHTHISWCDHTFNPWIGCTKIAPACDGCYAAHLMDTRLGRVKWDGPPVRTSAANWLQPLKWNRAAARHRQAMLDAHAQFGGDLKAMIGRQPFVFCSSLADVFDNQAERAWRYDLFDLIRATPNLTWLLLTKRPQNIVKMVKDVATAPWNGPPLPANAAIGTTIEDKKRLAMNAPALRDAKAELEPAFSFFSIEPLLEGLDVQPWLPSVDWIITGGETDQGAHKARPTHPQWFRDIRDQCAAAGVPYHHKQNGEWMKHRPTAGGDLGGDMRAGRVDIVHREHHSDAELCKRSFFEGDVFMRKVGKKHSGRAIDGVTHDAFPTLRVAP